MLTTGHGGVRATAVCVEVTESLVSHDLQGLALTGKQRLSKGPPSTGQGLANVPRPGLHSWLERWASNDSPSLLAPADTGLVMVPVSLPSLPIAYWERLGVLFLNL